MRKLQVFLHGCWWTAYDAWACSKRRAGLCSSQAWSRTRRPWPQAAPAVLTSLWPSQWPSKPPALGEPPRAAGMAPGQSPFRSVRQAAGLSEEMREPPVDWPWLPSSKNCMIREAPRVVHQLAWHPCAPCHQLRHHPEPLSSYGLSAPGRLSHHPRPPPADSRAAGRWTLPHNPNGVRSPYWHCGLQS